jgi:hypothetical protein
VTRPTWQAVEAVPEQADPRRTVRPAGRVLAAPRARTVRAALLRAPQLCADLDASMQLRSRFNFVKNARIISRIMLASSHQYEPVATR